MNELQEIRQRLAGIPDPRALLEGLFGYAPIAFQIYRADGHCLLTNPAFRDLFGSEPPPEYNILADDVAEERGLLPLFHRAFAGEVIRTPAIWYDPRELKQVRIEEGRRVAIASTFFPLRNRQGQVTHVAIVFEDFTAELQAREHADAERLEAHAAVREKEESLALLDTLMSSAPVGLAFVDPDLRYVRVNQALADINGRPIEDIEGRTLADVNPKLAIHLEPIYRRVIEHGEPDTHREITGETGSAPGRQRHWLTSHYPIRTKSGEVMGVGVVVHEISERKRFEEAHRFLAEAGEVLVSSLDFESALKNVAALAVPRLADWCQVYSLEAGTPRRVEVAHGDRGKAELLRELGRRYPLEPATSHPIMESLTTGKSVVLEETPDSLLQGVGRDAEHLKLLHELGTRSVLIAPIRGRAGVIGAIVLGTAESGRRYSSDDLVLVESFAARAGLALDNARLYEEAQRSIRMREELLAVVSHDLRTPIGSILTSAEILSKSAGSIPEDPHLDKRVAVIRRSAQRMTRLLQDLVDASSIETGHLAIEKQVHSIEELIEEVVSTFRPMAAEKELELHVDPDSAGGRALYDRDRLLQVFSNLLSNAIKFTPERGCIRLRVEREEEESAFRFSVADTGPGIDPADQAHVFDRYWKAAGSREGTGLGLFISKGIVEAHRGRIWLRSEPGAGSTFLFRIPTGSSGFE